jgi:drug/metabolite transporter (DMT)-like permease
MIRPLSIPKLWITTAQQHGNFLSFVGAAVTVVLWASAFAGIRAGLKSYSPESVALLRYLTASIVMLGFAMVKRLPVPEWRDLPGIAAMGFLGFSVYNVALNAGEVSVSAGVASFIVASAPIFMAMIAGLFFGDHLSLKGWGGILLCFLGVTIISFATDDGLNIDPRALLILLAAIVQAMYSVLQRPYLKKYGALAFISYVIWAGTLFLLIFTPRLLIDMKTASTNATLAVIYMGIFPGALAYASWSFVLSRINASVAGSFLYLVPFFAVLIAWLWLGEVPPPIALLGGLLIVCGLLVVNRLGKR